MAGCKLAENRHIEMDNFPFQKKRMIAIHDRQLNLQSIITLAATVRQQVGQFDKH